MQALPFQKIHQIEQMLEGIAIENLVLVFSQLDSDRYLLVYNTEDQPPPIANPTVQVLRLRDIRDNWVDYASFDGPVAGLSAIDVILQDVPTHGVNFYSIENIFFKRGEYQSWSETSYQLARSLLQYLRRLAGAEHQRSWRRGCAKVIQLALPKLLAAQALENLVAVLPVTDLDEYLDPSKRGYRLFYNDPSHADDVSKLGQVAIDSEAYWVAALEEVNLFDPRWERPRKRFIDLRIVLRQMQRDEILSETCRKLAWRCWCEWQASPTQQQFQNAAYVLAAETWLTREDTEDLVAFFPHEDFNHFLETGDALRLYRTPRPRLSVSSSPAGPRHSVKELLLAGVSAPEYNAPPLSFPVLSPVLERVSTKPVLDLGSTLLKAGQMNDLASTFWLLSRDLLERVYQEWLQISAEPGDITSLAIRAGLIYSLSDPWQWRQGRHSVFLRQCYLHLDRCFENQANHPEVDVLGYYYQALRLWYGCFTSEDYERNLNRMIQVFRNFLEHSQQHGQQATLFDQHKTAENLIGIGESILRPEDEKSLSRHDDIVPEWRLEIAEFLRDVADCQMPIHEPSSIFEQFSRIYFEVHESWRQLQQKAYTERPSVEELDQLLNRLRRWRRVIHAPAHELVVLDRIYSADIDYMNHFKQAMLGTGAIIEVTPRNLSVMLDSQATIVIDVQNIGSEAASQFWLELDWSTGLELVTKPTPMELPSFAPTERRRLDLQIRAKDPQPMFTLSYRYRDRHGQQQNDRKRIILEARRPYGVSLKPKINPFEVGRPVVGFKTQFFGRRDELHKILTRLAKGYTQPLVLRGPRRIGKSSLLRELNLILENREERQAIDISPELQSQISNIHPVYANLQSVDRTIPNYFESFLRVILKDICTGLALEREEIQRQLRAFGDQYPHEGSPRAFMEQLGEVFKRRSRERVVILIDELDEIFHEDRQEMAVNLRNIIESEKRVSWITASTRLTKGSVGKYGSPWFNLLETIELKGMDWESAVQLITQLSANAGFDWGIEAAAPVLELTGLRPYLIQLLCARVIDYLNQKGQDKVEISTVRVVINQMLEDSDTTNQYLGFIWNEATGMGQLILWVLDSRSPNSLSQSELCSVIKAELQRHALEMDNKAFNHKFDERMEWLERIAGAISANGAGVKFSIPLIQRWLRQIIFQKRDIVEQALETLAQELGRI